MSKINIKIPVGLSIEQEVFAIAKALSQKLLPEKQKKIGNGIEIQNLQTEIVIERENVEKIEKTKECPICQTVFMLETGFKIYTNYGGDILKKFCCSKGCGLQFIDINPNRIKLKRSEFRYIASR